MTQISMKVTHSEEPTLTDALCVASRVEKLVRVDSVRMARE